VKQSVRLIHVHAAAGCSLQMCYHTRLAAGSGQPELQQAAQRHPSEHRHALNISQSFQLI
jgi:hypothetical protein